jgi:hypothetical protein
MIYHRSQAAIIHISACIIISIIRGIVNNWGQIIPFEQIAMVSINALYYNLWTCFTKPRAVPI